MNFYEHKLNIRVILDDNEEKKLKDLTAANAAELHVELTEKQMLQKLIEQAITEKLSGESDTMPDAGTGR